MGIQSSSRLQIVGGSLCATVEIANV